MRAALWTLLALAACTQPVPVPPCPAVTINIVPPAPVVEPQRPAAERAVVRGFDRAKVRELAVVFAAGITADQIQAIHSADREARRALQALGRRPNAATLDDARTAVQSLEAALEPPT